MGTMDKETRLEKIRDVLREDPGKTDGELAALFGVSVATIRLDRRTLGIPQKKDRLEAAVKPHRDEAANIIELEAGKQGMAVVLTTPLIDARGIVPAETLYGIARKLAQKVIGEHVTPIQMGNIKYKVPVGAGEVLIAQARLSHERGLRQYIYVQISSKNTEIFRAKFIMDTAR